MITFLFPLNSSTEPSRKWRLTSVGSRMSFYLKQTQKYICKSSVPVDIRSHWLQKVKIK